MANTQKFTPFDPELESWDSYLVQFDCNLEANELTSITDNQKRAIFLSNCGREVFEMAHAIIAPDPLQTVPWAMLIQKLTQHYAPKPSCIARWHTFYRKNQVEAALYCEFRDLDEILRDRLVSGVQDIRLQRHLLARSTSTLKEALDEAVTSEQSGRSVEEI
ncbi:hypothetical protein E2320_016666 [Naja naja]|nr:hypothetical protein E2320_016666 [Naja naja]